MLWTEAYPDGIRQPVRDERSATVAAPPIDAIGELVAIFAFAGNLRWQMAASFDHGQACAQLTTTLRDLIAPLVFDIICPAPGQGHTVEDIDRLEHRDLRPMTDAERAAERARVRFRLSIDPNPWPWFTERLRILENA